MTGIPALHGPADGADGLGALLRSELSAVHAWQHALRSAEGRDTVDAEEVIHFASEHQRTVAALQLAIRDSGGVPSSEAATSGAFWLPGNGATLRELLEGEMSGLAMYEAATGGLDGDARDLVTLELIPRQHKHIAELSAILSRRAA